MVIKFLPKKNSLLSAGGKSYEVSTAWQASQNLTKSQSGNRLSFKFWNCFHVFAGLKTNENFRQNIGPLLFQSFMEIDQKNQRNSKQTKSNKIRMNQSGWKQGKNYFFKTLITCSQRNEATESVAILTSILKPAWQENAKILRAKHFLHFDWHRHFNSGT